MPNAESWQKAGLGASKSQALATGTAPSGTRGIHVNIAGDIVGKLQEDAADATFSVNAGTTYPYSFKSITNLGTATGNFLF